jgi:hypothetical protein
LACAVQLHSAVNGRDRPKPVVKNGRFSPVMSGNVTATPTGGAAPSPTSWSSSAGSSATSPTNATTTIVGSARVTDRYGFRHRDPDRDGLPRHDSYRHHDRHSDQHRPDRHRRPSIIIIESVAHVPLLRRLSPIPRAIALVGYFVRVIDTGTGNVVTLASDNGGTPIETTSGVANMCKTDDRGGSSFYVAFGSYHLDIYAPDAATFVFRLTNVDMGEATAIASSAASSAQASAATATANAAQTSADRTQTGADRTQTGADRTQVAADRASADASAALALSASGVAGAYPNAYASALPRGVTSTTSLVAGSGGTNGTFALGFSGGSITGMAGTFTVAGGALTAITITNPGLGTGTTPPTLGFTASGRTDRSKRHCRGCAIGRHDQDLLRGIER